MYTSCASAFTNTEMILNVQIKITCIILNTAFLFYMKDLKRIVLLDHIKYLSLPVTLVETWQKHTINMVTIRDGL
jgi:hypothetical protein